MIAVVLPTFNRRDLVWETCVRIKSNLITTEDIQFFIGDAGSDDVAAKFKGQPNVTVIRPESRFLGNNLNTLLRAANQETDIILQMDDDHWLRDPLDVDDHIKVLRDPLNPVKWIRLMGVAAHSFDARLVGSYWRVRWDSPEVYIPSNRPHLKNISFHAYYGLYPENLKLGETEEGFCHNCIDLGKQDLMAPVVGIPVNLRTETLWDHVGQSWQERGF